MAFQKIINSFISINYSPLKHIVYYNNLATCSEPVSAKKYLDYKDGCD